MHKLGVPTFNRVPTGVLQTKLPVFMALSFIQHFASAVLQYWRA